MNSIFIKKDLLNYPFKAIYSLYLLSMIFANWWFGWNHLLN